MVNLQYWAIRIQDQTTSIIRFPIREDRIRYIVNSIILLLIATKIQHQREIAPCHLDRRPRDLGVVVQAY